MMRGYEFARAFKDGRFNDMLQTTHPGVTVLWLTGIVIYATLFLKHTLFTNDSLPIFIYSTQFAVALLNTALVPVIYLLLQRLFKNRAISVTAALLIAWNPWLVGYSRVVHIDAVVTGFMLAAALSLLIWAQEGYPRRWLVFSAVLAALAVLSKAPAIFLIPYFWLVVLVFGVQRWRRRLLEFVWWLLIIIVLFVLLWPAMLWVPDKTGNARVLKRDYMVAATTPHDISESFSTNLWHYPATLITRTEPAVLLLCLVLVGLLIRPLPRRFAPVLPLRKGEKKIEWLLAAYVFFFIVMMTIGAKKGDRYILPIAPVMDIVAVLGLAALLRGRKFIIAASILVLVSAGTVIYHHPYALAYSNPFFPNNLSQELGWGEGLEQVGAWLNQQAGKSKVASWYPDELGYFTEAAVVHINAHEQPAVRYIVLYHNMFGRPVEHPANNFIDEYYKKWKPVFVAHVAQKEYAWVYEKPVFDKNVGELTSGRVVRQTISVRAPQFIGLEVLAATYTGRATEGELVVSMKDLHEWRVPVSKLNDTGWTQLLLPRPVELAGQELTVTFSGAGTNFGNAPTIRSGTSGLAIRQLFSRPAGQAGVNGVIANEYETKLLEQSAGRE